MKGNDIMTQKQVITAYKALENLSRQTLPIKEAYALHKLRGKLKTAFDFQIEQENALLEKLTPKIEDGKLFFQSVDDAQLWRNEINDIDNMESDIEIDAIKIMLNDDIQISSNEIDALEGFVDFIEV